MTFCFRLRFNLGSTVKLVSDKTELVFDPGPPLVVLRGADGSRSLGDARRLALYGAGYSTDVAAANAGTTWRGWLVSALARCYIGAEFGDRTMSPRMTKEGLVFFAKAFSTTADIRQDVHGLDVYPCQPSDFAFPRAAEDRPTRLTRSWCIWRRSVGARTRQAAGRSAVEIEVGGPIIGKPLGRLQQAVSLARQQDIPPSTAREVAFDLFGASFSLNNPDARFITLFMAVETLLEPRDRPVESVRLVDAFIQSVRANDELSESERESLIGTLRWMRKESIGQAGRHLSASLEPRRYGGDDPVTFYKRCSALRNDLVHGVVPRPSIADVSASAGDLETFVADLLSGSLAPHLLRP